MHRAMGWKKGFMSIFGENKWIFATSAAVRNPFKNPVITLWGKSHFFGEKWRERWHQLTFHSIYFAAGTYSHLTCTFTGFQLTCLNFFRHSVSQHYLTASCREEDFGKAARFLINFPLSDQPVYRAPINVAPSWLVFALGVAPVPRVFPTCRGIWSCCFHGVFLGYVSVSSKGRQFKKKNPKSI